MKFTKKRSIIFNFNSKHDIIPFVSLAGYAAQRQKNLVQFELEFHNIQTNQ